MQEWRDIGMGLQQLYIDGVKVPGQVRTTPSGAGASPSATYDQSNIPGFIFNNTGPNAGKWSKQDGSLATQQEIDAALAPKTSHSSSTSQSFQDPRALDLQERQISASIDEAKRRLDTADRAQNFTEMKYWQDRLDTLSQSQSNMAWDKEKYYGTQGAQADAANRAADSDEANRAERAAEFALTHGLNERQYQASMAKMEADILNQKEQIKLSANDQLARNISNTDPAAYQAYLLGNSALSRPRDGATALSDNAMLPSSRALETLQTIEGKYAGALAQRQANQQAQAAASARSAPPAPVYQKPGIIPGNTSVMGVGEVKYVPGQGYVSVATGRQVGAGGNGDPASDPNFRSNGYMGTPAPSPALPAGAPSWVQNLAGTPASNYATGTEGYGFQAAPHGMFDVGELEREHMQIVDPPGANNAQMRVVPGAMGRNMRGYAEGTPVQQPYLDHYGNQAVQQPIDQPDPAIYGDATVQDKDQQYLSQIRDLRTRTKVPDLRPFHTQFFYEDPALRNAYYSARQSKYGIPVESQIAAAQRYRLSGASRGSIGQRW